MQTAECRSGHFEAIYRANYSAVRAFALRRCRDRSAAEEAVADTFLVAWRRLDDVPSEPLPWLLGTARKIIANQHRKLRRRAALGPQADMDTVEVVDPATPIDEAIAERQAFAEAFASLRLRDREVLALVAWDGLDARDAARVMNCTAAVFSLRLHRAKQRLMAAAETVSGSTIEKRSTAS